MIDSFHAVIGNATYFVILIHRYSVIWYEFYCYLAVCFSGDYLYREGKKVSIHFYDAPSIENKPKKTLGPNDGTDNNKEIR